jgi:hypothetical protein
MELLKLKQSHAFNPQFHYHLMTRTPHKILFKVTLDYKIQGFEVFELSDKNLNDVLIRLSIDHYYHLPKTEKMPNEHHMVYFYRYYNSAKSLYDSL